MSHCFDIGPLSSNLLMIDPISEILASATKQLIRATSGEFVDIGAYRGNWTDYVYNNNTDIIRRIHVFEPDTKSYKYLIHKYKTIKLIDVNNLAIYSSKQIINFFENGAESTCTYGCNRQVPSTSIDSLYKNRLLGIVKIRTNGSECNIISGMQETMKNNNIESVIFDFIPINTGYIDNKLYIETYLLALKHYFTFIYIIEREHLKIITMKEEIDVYDFIEDMCAIDCYDCICSRVEIKFES